MEAKTNRCIVENCKNKSTYLFFPPENSKLLKEWQKAVNTTEKDFTVCLNHFKRKDVLIEKTLEENAVPTKNIENTELKLTNSCCGSCLAQLEVHKIMVKKEIKTNFHEITEYDLLTDFICPKCCNFLKSYSEFKKDITKKHKALRELEVEDDDEDCVIVVDEEKKKVNEVKKCEKEVVTASAATTQQPKFIVHHLPNFNITRPGNLTKIMLSCKHCVYKTYNNNDLEDHIAAKHKFNCKYPKCSFFCNNKIVLVQHERRVHRNEILQPITKVSQQPASTASSSALSSTSAPKKTYHNCPLCKTCCYSELDLEIHTSIYHSNKPLPNVRIKRTVCKPNSQLKTVEEITIRTTRNNSNMICEETFSEESNDVTMRDDEIQSYLPEIKEEIKEELNEIEIKDVSEILGEVKEKSAKKDEEEKDSELFGDMRFFEDDYHDDDDEEEEEELDDDEDLTHIRPAKSKNIVHNPKVKCLDCHEEMNVRELLRHREIEHPETEKTSYEDIRFVQPPSPSSLTAARNLKVACDVCFREVQEWKLEEHKATHHGQHAKSFLCHICSARFVNVHNLNHHLNVHNPKEIFHCDICGRSFPFKRYLLKHMMRKHRHIYNPVSVCKICNQKLYKRSLIESHAKNYHPDGLDEGYRVNSETNFFDCERCAASYANIYALKRHNCEKGRFQLRCLDCFAPCKNQKQLENHRKLRCRKRNKFSIYYDPSTRTKSN